MRLFFAINFNQATRSRLTALRDTLREASAYGNFSVSENLHLTLAFLGECDVREAAAAKTVLSWVRFAPFDITVDRVGRFQRDTGELWWAGLSESRPLSHLRQDLADRLAAAGLELERRRFIPHITLGREVMTRASPWATEPFGQTVVAIDLMRSEHVGGKLRYTVIASSA